MAAAADMVRPWFISRATGAGRRKAIDSRNGGGLSRDAEAVRDT
jgi:hypothetical protein